MTEQSTVVDEGERQAVEQGLLPPRLLPPQRLQRPRRMLWLQGLLALLCWLWVIPAQAGSDSLRIGIQLEPPSLDITTTSAGTAPTDSCRAAAMERSESLT